MCWHDGKEPKKKQMFGRDWLCPAPKASLGRRAETSCGRSVPYPSLLALCTRGNFSTNVRREPERKSRVGLSEWRRRRWRGAEFCCPNACQPSRGNPKRFRWISWWSKRGLPFMSQVALINPTCTSNCRHTDPSSRAEPNFDGRLTT